MLRHFSNQNFSGIAAAGILRLLLPTQAYNLCRGGATTLAHYAVYNGTGANGTVYYAADDVRVWQVCICEWKIRGKYLAVF